MPFNTLSYFLFLPVVFLLHYFIPDRFRWMVLLGASFFFYSALKAPHLIAVLLLITTITYFTGIWIDRKEDPRTKQYLLWGGISANLLVLIILKYLPFITQNLNVLLKQLAPGTTVPVSKTIIAIGVSYFIFQAISYLIDIYLEIEKPERHYGHFALYMSFFPKLLQGPIERGGDLLPQFKIPYIFNYDNVRSGMLLFAWGMFKKAVIADRLAYLVNPVFDNVHGYSGLPLLFATYMFALQIYFDFAGYTDMAIGTARMFNIKLTQNFNSPYLATSVADFWRRWHISFSRWILDYIFKPLQMSLRNWKNWGIAFSLLITFIISGIWHGANWTYVAWGVIHGILLAGSVLFRPLQKKIHKTLSLEKTICLKVWQIIITFNLVCLAWVFFRAKSLIDAFYVISTVFSKSTISAIRKLVHFEFSVLNLGENIVEIPLLFISLICIACVKYSSDKVDIFQKNTVARWMIYYLLIMGIILLNKYSPDNFIYFKF